MEFGHIDGEAFAVSKMFDRVNHPPRGRGGGDNGSPARVTLGSGPDLKGMGREVIPPGDTMVLETAGGGGRGDASKRDAAAVETDRKNGLIS